MVICRQRAGFLDCVSHIIIFSSMPEWFSVWLVLKATGTRPFSSYSQGSDLWNHLWTGEWGVKCIFVCPPSHEAPYIKTLLDSHFEAM